jgi:cholesterol transport system auxiliary component
MKVNLPALLLFPLLIVNAGCGMTPKQPALHDFGQAISKVNDTNFTTSKPVITVDAPTWLWDNRIRYRLLYASSTQVGFYALDQWIASPPELFQQQLTALGKMPTFIFRIQLQEFEQQFDAPDKARVLLHFTVDVFSVDHKQKLGSKEYRLQQPTITPNASGAVIGFSQLIKQAGEQINNWAINVSN